MGRIQIAMLVESPVRVPLHSVVEVDYSQKESECTLTEKRSAGSFCVATRALAPIEQVSE